MLVWIVFFSPVRCSRSLLRPLLTQTQTPPEWLWPCQTHTTWSTCLSGCWCCRPPRWCSPCATLAPWRRTAPATWPHPPWCLPRCSRSSPAPCWFSWSVVSSNNEGDQNSHNAPPVLLIQDSVAVQCFSCSLHGRSLGSITNNTPSVQISACRQWNSCWGRRLWTDLPRPWSWPFLQGSTLCRTICSMLPCPTWMQPPIR